MYKLHIVWPLDNFTVLSFFFFFKYQAKYPIVYCKKSKTCGLPCPLVAKSSILSCSYLWYFRFTLATNKVIRSTPSYAGVPLYPLSVSGLSGVGWGGAAQKTAVSPREPLGMFLLGCSRLVFTLTEHLNSLCQIPFSLVFLLSFVVFLIALSLIFLKILILILRPSAILISCVCLMFTLLFRVKHFFLPPSVSLY